MKTVTSIVIGCLCVLRVGATIPPGYYDRADGKKKAALKEALHTIIADADVLDYGSGAGATWSGFYETDRMANNQVRDRYSNEIFYFKGSAGSVPSGMNIEHAFPKSWWGGSKTQAYKDIHHLMPCESKINSSKSNYPMGKVTTVKTTNGCTKIGTGPGANGKNIQLWEPDDKWKGDFARVYFYMATCYQEYTWSGEQALSTLEKNTWPTLQPWAYQLFLQWCKDDPVDAIERERNEAVYRIQGNRNPFVDYPNLAEYVWGDSINYAFSVDGSATGDPDPGPDEPGDGDITTLLAESFAQHTGDFEVVHYDGTPSSMWSINTSYACAMANAFNKGKTADDWLVSPELDLSGYKAAKLTFEHAAGYHKSNPLTNLFQVMVTEAYAGVPSASDWTALSPTYPGSASSGFTSFVPSGDVDLTPFVGKKITLAFRYQSTSSACYAWEVKNVKVEGETLPVRIDQNFASPVEAEDAVFTLGGTYVGKTLPSRRGIYIVRKNGYTYKVVNP